MKQVFTRMVLPVIFLAAVSCSTPVQVQQDAAINLHNYHTYSWVETHANENDNAARATAYADISMHNAVNTELQKAGWREVTSHPDALISYDLLVERSREQRSDPVYSQPYSRMYYNPYRRTWTSVYYPSQFVGYQNYTVPVKEGTITLTITDANTDKPIWQGWTTESMGSRLTESQVTRSVHNIFRKFNRQP